MNGSREMHHAELCSFLTFINNTLTTTYKKVVYKSSTPASIRKDCDRIAFHGTTSPIAEIDLAQVIQVV